MMDLPANETLYLFIVDTNDYAGNFERQMVAFMTGCVGECGVGGQEAVIAKRELGEETCDMFSDLLRSMPDDHGCRRPASIWESPGESRRYNSVAMVLATIPDQETIALLQERARRYAASPPSKWVDPMKILGFRLLEYKIDVTQRDLLTQST